MAARASRRSHARLRLSEIGETAGVESAVGGDVRRGDDYRLDLALVDKKTAF